MREIEIKAKVHDVEALLGKLRAAGITLSEPITQRDVVYNEPGATSNTPGFNFLRVRTVSTGKAYFTLKQTVKDLDKIEHETEITNPDEMLAMVQLMHYELFNDLTKTRRSGKVGDYELNVDEIDGLGAFVEVEKLCDDTVDSDAVRDELWQFLGQFGVTRDDEVTKGYDILMREHLENHE